MPLALALRPTIGGRDPGFCATHARVDALGLARIRAERQVTQVELAARLDRSQGNVSELERRTDVYLSTLREYVEALGGELEVSAVFDGKRHAIAVRR